MINIIRIDPNKIKVDENSYKHILIYHAKYRKTFISDKVNGYIDEHNGNKCLTILHTDKDKDALKRLMQL